MFGNYSKEAINNAESNIYKHIIKDFNFKGQLSSGNNADNMPIDLKGTIFYQAIFDSETWNNCDLTDVSGNGTIFKKNDFYKTDIHNAGMQYCSFTNDVFQNCSLIGSNFANSTFVYCAIQDSKIHGCSFLGTEFHFGIIRHTEISSSNFELCSFNKSIFENLDLRELTLNYAMFNDVTMKNVCLPFLQIPYTFNGLQYVFETRDDINISSHNPQINKIELSEYKEMIEDFTIFFDSKRQYFPLTNCYIVQDKMDMAITCNETGIKTSAALHDFRSLYFFCIQASEILKISREKRGLLYSEINKILSNTKLTGGEYHQFYIYFPMIKKLLFDTPYNNPVMTLRIQTNIEPSDYKRLSILFMVLEKATSECKISLDSKHIEIRHNSPNVIDYFSSGQYQDLIINLKSIFHVLRPAISDLANIITIGSSFIKVKNKLKHKTSNNTNYLNKDKNKHGRIIKDLRIELEKFYKNNEESHKQSSLFNTNPENTFFEKLADIRNELNQSGIVITGIEVQFLDGKGDILDNLYNHGGSLLN